MGLTFNLGRDSAALTSDASLNVGIGAAPSGTYKLEVTGTAKVSSTLLVSGAATLSGTETTLNFNPQTNLLSGYYYLNFGGGSIMYRNTTDIYIGSNSKYGSAGTTVANYTSANGMGMLTMDGGTLNYQSNATSVTAGTVYSMPIRFSITGAGNVGIGTNSPAFKLHAYQNGVNTFIAGTATITDNGQQCGCVALATYSGVDRGSTHAMYKHTGISYPATYVSFYSGNTGFGYLYIDDSNILRISGTSGDIGLAAGTVIGTQTSDIRLKNVKESFDYGLSDILKINPIAFTFKNDIKNIDKLGFSAQEMLNIIPEAVYDTNNCIDGYDDTDDPMIRIPKSNDTIYGMDYTTIIPVLVKAMQEQNQIITSLQDRLDKAGL